MFVCFVTVALGIFVQFSLGCGVHDNLGTHRTVRTPSTATAEDVSQHRRHLRASEACFRVGGETESVEKKEESKKEIENGGQGNRKPRLGAGHRSGTTCYGRPAVSLKEERAVNRPCQIAPSCAATTYLDTIRRDVDERRDRIRAF